ncbi:hypothetical protein [Roseibium sp.]|uniref:hypothetical protein n=1 Tax=Roseibium sp. TaxID=1936156 RepID=UPI003A9708A0
MSGWNSATKIYIFVTVALLCLVLSFRGMLPDTQHVYLETFDNKTIDEVIGGRFVEEPTDPTWRDRHAKKYWSFSTDGHRMVWKNTQHPNSTHFLDIPWVAYDDGLRLFEVNEADISVTVKAQTRGRGGAGVLIGSGMSGYYWLFALDGNGNYHLLRKAGRNLHPATRARHPAIKMGADNRISYVRTEDTHIFSVNGEEVLRVPNIERRHALKGVGIGAFGKGSYEFDDLKITQSEENLESLGQALLSF